jgi:hypothetical protein
MAERPPRRRDEDDEDDRPRKRRPVDDDEDDDRPRKRRSRDDDDEDDDDRPRRRRSRDDDDEDDDDRPRRRRSRDDDDDDRSRSGGKPNWKNVKLGLLLATIGLWILFGTMAIGALATLFSMIGMMAQAITMFQISGVMNQISTSIMLVAGIVTVIGFIFGSLTANKEGHMVFSILAASAFGVWLILVLIFRLIPMFQNYPFGMLGLGFGYLFVQIMINLLLSAGWLMAALYLRTGALLLKNKTLAGAAMNLVIMISILAGLQLVLPLIDHATIATAAGRVLHWILIWPPLVMSMIVLIWLILGLQKKRAML